MKTKCFLILFTLKLLVFGQLNLKAQEALRYGSDTLLILSDQDGMSSAERSFLYQSRLKSFISDSLLPTRAIEILYHDNKRVLNLAGQPLMDITPSDAKLNQTSIDSLAEEIQHSLAQELPPEIKYQDPKNFWKLFLQVIVFISTIGLCYMIFILFKRLDKWSNKKVKNLVNKGKIKTYEFKNVELLHSDRQVWLLELLLRIFRVILTAIFIYLTIPLAFSLFPETAHLSDDLLRIILIPLSKLFAQFIAFLPTLINIIVLVLIAHYLLRFVGFLSDEVEKENIHINGFHPEWAKPSYRLIKTSVLIIVAAIILPMFAFTHTPLFLGLLAFTGLTVVLGSVRAMTNFIAGIQMAFMRPFKRGDRVKIGNTSGKVLYYNLINTKIRTKFNEIISVPNGEVIQSHIINYSSSENELGLVLYIEIAIPTRYSHHIIEPILQEACVESKGIIANPKPHVIKTNIDKNHTLYQLNAYCQQADKMYATKNQIYGNILDRLLENGISLD